jgi:hypothetical protein
MTLTPSSTGTPRLDELNRKFGVTNIVSLFPDSRDDLDGFLIVNFRKPLDIETVAEIYHQQIGAEIELDSTMGDGDHIERVQKEGEPIHYVFSVGSGDCPAGCTHRVFYGFNLYPEAKGFRVAKVSEGPEDPARAGRFTPGPPKLNVPAASASLGPISGTAIDTAGNVLFRRLSDLEQSVADRID